MDTEMDGMATGLTDCITKDGQSTPTNNIPFGGFKLLNIGAATLPGDAVNAGQIQGGLLTYFADTGAADAYVITPAPAVASYVAGQSWKVKIANTNTTTSTIAVNGLAAKTIKRPNGDNVSAGDLVAGAIIDLTYDGTNFKIEGVITGDVTLTGTQTLTNKTLTSPKINQILDSNGNEEIIFTTTASAVNEVTFANAATGGNPKFSATGGDTNIGMDFQAKGTGVYRALGTATASAEYRLFEDTDNGTDYVGFKAPASVTTAYTMTFPAALPGSTQGIRISSAGAVTFDGTGKLVNRVKTEYSTASSGSVAIPLDSTKPQITEGAAVFSATAYTPADAANIINVKCLVWTDNATQAYVLAAIFKDSGADAVAAGGTNSTGGAIGFIELDYQFTAGSTSAFTMSLRVGAADGSATYWNRDAAGNTLGGMTSFFEITEYTP